MPIFETFSKRQKRLEGKQPDVYQYDKLPDTFRRQVIHIWATAIGLYYDDAPLYSQPDSNMRWQRIHETLCREMGVFHLGRQPSDNRFVQCQQHVGTAGTESALDLVELTFRVIDTQMRKSWVEENLQDPDSAIDELNHRFREHGIGYQFAGGELVKVDSEYIHTEAIKPALVLLREKRFRGASEEFLNAHEHYRRGRNKEAIVDALKAFESTMKAICDARKWSYPAGATAKALIATILDHGLVPTDLQSHFTALRSVMESGLPTVRNRTSGHGQGKDPITIPGYFAAFALHLAASNIVFLVEAHKISR